MGLEVLSFRSETSSTSMLCICYVANAIKFTNFGGNFIFVHSVKDIFATLKIHNRSMIYRIAVSPFSRGLYFRETL